MEEEVHPTTSELPAGMFIGVAGWSIPTQQATLFGEAGSHLERYARVFNAVELNRSFYALPRATTVRRWVQCVPASFRFSLKLSKHITHELRCKGALPALREFTDMALEFGRNLGPVLVQTPPSLEAEDHVLDMLEQFRELYTHPVVVEPRHPSWTHSRVDRRLKELYIARVAADPARSSELALPGGHEGMAYFRLHGAPRIYWSAYEDEVLRRWAAAIQEARSEGKEVWVIFDNTARDAAIPNAMEMQRLLRMDG